MTTTRKPRGLRALVLEFAAAELELSEAATAINRARAKRDAIKNRLTTWRHRG